MKKILFGINKTEPVFPFDWIKPGESLEIAKEMGYASNLEEGGFMRKDVLVKMEEVAAERVKNGHKHIFWMRKE